MTAIRVRPEAAQQARAAHEQIHRDGEALRGAFGSILRGERRRHPYRRLPFDVVAAVLIAQHNQHKSQS